MAKFAWDHESCARLRLVGFSNDDALTLRGIAMTLHRWHEMECGESNDFASWSITRGDMVDGLFVHDESGKPYRETHYHRSNKPSYTRIADKEKGAIKRLEAILARYPDYGYFIQGDPRGASLYILRRDDYGWVDADNYNRGIAVYK